MDDVDEKRIPTGHQELIFQRIDRNAAVIPVAAGYRFPISKRQWR
jgi:hypothetical protein